MKRRDFFKRATLAGISTGLTFSGLRAALAESKMEVESTPDMVAVMGGEPDVMLEKALAEMGGIGQYVKAGNKVVIKPNIGWDRAPELAANTNPILVAAMVKQCLSAGAKEVVVFDHTCDTWDKCYENSGIKAAVNTAGGIMISGNDESMYKEVANPKGVMLKSAKVHKVLLECDVWFNMPVLKHHSGAKMSVAMKNLMGIVFDRQYFHRNDLQQCIADSCLLIKKPALNIVDAYRIMHRNGPQGISEKDVATLKTLIVSPDIVAVDTASIKLFNQVKKMPIETVGHIAKAEEHKLGTQKIESLNVKRIKL